MADRGTAVIADFRYGRRENLRMQADTPRIVPAGVRACLHPYLENEEAS
ncbi:hypothetical protein [Microbacterium sp. NPDC057650]